MKVLFLMVLLIGSTSALAMVRVPVSWGCVLLNDPVECRELRDAFEAANPGFTIVGLTDDSRLSIRIGKNQLNSYTEYVVRLTIKDQPTKEYKKRLADTLSSYEKTEKVTGFLQVTIDAAKEELEYQDEPKREKPFYIEPAFDIEGGKQPGYNYRYAGFNPSADYSTKKVRLEADGKVSAKTEVQEENAFSKKIESHEVRIGAGGGGAYSITPRVSVGAFGGYTQTKTDIETEEVLGIPEDARHNMATRTHARVGVEWIQHPLIDDKTNGNFYLRAYVQGEQHHYTDPDTFEIVNETFARPSLQAGYMHQFKSFSVTGSVTGFRSVGREEELQGVLFTGNASFNIKDSVIIEPKFSMDYTKNRVRTTAGTQYSFLSLTGMDKNDNITYNYGLTLKIPLGNARLSRQERRWKD
jgi:hypothetical protein